MGEGEEKPLNKTIMDESEGKPVDKIKTMEGSEEKIKSSNESQEKMKINDESEEIIDEKTMGGWADGGFFNKVQIVISNITVEPLMLCYILPSVMANLAIQNLNLEKACRVDLGFDDEICTAMALRNVSGYNETEEVQVQKLVADMAALRNFFQSIFPCILLLFIGSWSDRNKKRLPCIILPIIGEMAAMCGFITCTYFFYELPILVNAISEGIPGLSGSWSTMCVGTNAYISDVSNKDTRTLRIGALNLFTNISIPIGIALSGILFVRIRFYGVFSLSLVMLTAGLVYGLLYVKEVPCNKEDIIKRKKTFLADFFDFRHVKETFQVAFKKGERNRRARIIVIMILVMLVIGPLNGEMTVLYLFVRYKYHWNEIDFSTYLTFHFIIQIIGTSFTLLFLSKYLKMGDATIGIWSSISKVLSCFLYAFAPTTAWFYFGAVLEGLQGTSFIAMRAIISKLVPQDELGKIYSLFGLSEALMPMVYGPLYSLVYRSTIQVYPSTFFLVGGGLTMPCIFIFTWLYYEQKRDEALAQEEENNIFEKATLLDPALSTLTPPPITPITANGQA